MDIELLKELLSNDGYEDSVLFENPSYETAVIGISDTGQVCYSYNKMVEYLMKTDEMTEEDAIDFIDYNTIRALPYASSYGNRPIVVYDYYE